MRTFNLPLWLPIVIIILTISLIAGLTRAVVDARKELAASRELCRDLDEVRRKTAGQTLQLFAFADKINLLEEEMDKIRQFDRKLRNMTGRSEVLEQMTSLGIGGSDSMVKDPDKKLKAEARELIRQMHRDLDRLLAETSYRELSQHEMARLLEDSKSIISSTPSILPLKGPKTSYFGYRKNPFGGKSTEFHRGLDISGPHGAPIIAPAEGVVVSVGRSSGYGLIVSINHGYGLVTRYAHLSKAYVEEGQQVRRGQRIAAVGSSGRATGPHLHYETILNGIPVNPLRFVAVKE